MKEKLNAVADAQVRSKGTIKRSTAILIDKSASQQTSIEVGKRIAAMVSAVCENDLWVYAFDSMPYAIVPKTAKPEMSDWEKAFAGIRANGNTSCGAGLAALLRDKHSVESVVVVSDGGETSHPTFVDAYQQYALQFGKPSVCMVKLPGDPDTMTGRCKAAGIEVDIYPFTGDYYSLPGLIPFLTKPSRFDLLMTIMNWEIPKRRTS